VVRLDSTPPHAAVYDESGALLGRTPLAYAMVGSPGVRRFRFALEGHQDKVLEVIASADSNQSVRLEAHQPVATRTADEPGDPGGEAIRAASADQGGDQADLDQGVRGKRQDRRRRDRSPASTGPGADQDDTSSSDDTPAPEPKTTPKPDPNPDPTGDPVIKNPFAK
jgi:hypothetical protein